MMNKKTETLEIDLQEFDKETLICLIVFAHKLNKTFNETIEEILTSFLKENSILQDENQLPPL